MTMKQARGETKSPITYDQLLKTLGLEKDQKKHLTSAFDMVLPRGRKSDERPTGYDRYVTLCGDSKSLNNWFRKTLDESVVFQSHDEDADILEGLIRSKNDLLRTKQ